jgi:hypothetical protein
MTLFASVDFALTGRAKGAPPTVYLRASPHRRWRSIASLQLRPGRQAISPPEIGEREAPIDNGHGVFSPIMPDRHHGGIVVDLDNKFMESLAMRRAPVTNAAGTSHTMCPLFTADAQHVLDEMLRGQDSDDEVCVFA